MQPLNVEIEDCNIGNAENPKMIKLSKTLPPDQKLKYIELFKNFKMFLHGAMKILSPIALL